MVIDVLTFYASFTPSEQNMKNHSVHIPQERIGKIPVRTYHPISTIRDCIWGQLKIMVSKNDVNQNVIIFI